MKKLLLSILCTGGISLNAETVQRGRICNPDKIKNGTQSCAKGSSCAKSIMLSGDPTFRCK